MAERIVAIIDSGGRGSALAAAYAPWIDGVAVIPGNDAVRLSVPENKLINDPRFRNIEVTNKKKILEICRHHSISLLDVAQDNAVERGLVEVARASGIPTVGSTRAAGELEWSKIFTRDLGQKLGLRQPKFTVYDDPKAAFADIMVHHYNQPCVVKADGLCKGKGAIVANNREAAVLAVQQMRSFGDAGKRFLIEEYLCNDDGTPGQEFSFFVLCNGGKYALLGSAEDYKRAHVFDQGPNTGGMGGNNKPLFMDKERIQRIEDDFIGPILNEMNKLGRPYTGVLYMGGMIINHHNEGEFEYLVELNSRWGDPEAQLILPGIKNDWYEVGMKAAGVAEGGFDLKFDNKERVVVAVCSKGYPTDYSEVKGKVVNGIEKVLEMDGVKFFGAGLKWDGKNWLANGGRLLYCVGEDDDFLKARSKAVAAASMISIEDNSTGFRSDIAWRKMEEYYRKLKGGPI